MGDFNPGIRAYRDANKETRAGIIADNTGVWKVSNISSVIRSLFAFRFSGAPWNTGPNVKLVREATQLTSSGKRLCARRTNLIRTGDHFLMWRTTDNGRLDSRLGSSPVNPVLHILESLSITRAEDMDRYDISLWREGYLWRCCLSSLGQMGCNDDDDSSQLEITSNEGFNLFGYGGRRNVKLTTGNGTFHIEREDAALVNGSQYGGSGSFKFDKEKGIDIGQNVTVGNQTVVGGPGRESSFLVGLLDAFQRLTGSSRH
ncbi:unnamed protein product [Angiostrongylus costaricensis]|uniref:Endo/exonuclease/phosphatase domain-containing protein n=1 Tax=Angiostrongylus costaricensis TaxID=334426 RepID=A0A0R3PS40_ANGCS|nr:unnamed protein product [Angiostrongylus costaricensis]